MLFYIEAKISIKVQGISGPFEGLESNLVNATSMREAQQKFEAHVRQKHSDKMPQSIKFDYTKLAYEIR